MSASKNYAIIGGGITGVNCALALSDCGYKVHLFESRQELLSVSNGCVRRINITGFHYSNELDQSSVGRANRRWLKALLKVQPHDSCWVQYERVNYYVVTNSNINDDEINNLINSVKDDYEECKELQLDGYSAEDLISEVIPINKDEVPKGVHRHFKVLEGRVKMVSDDGEDYANSLRKKLNDSEDIDVKTNHIVDSVVETDQKLVLKFCMKDTEELKTMEFDGVYDCSNSDKFTRFENNEIEKKYKFSCEVPLNDEAFDEAEKIGSCLNVWTETGWGVSIVPENKSLLVTAEEVTKNYQEPIYSDKQEEVTKSVFNHISELSPQWRDIFSSVTTSKVSVNQNKVTRFKDHSRGKSFIAEIGNKVFKCFVDKMANAYVLAETIKSNHGVNNRDY